MENRPGKLEERRRLLAASLLGALLLAAWPDLARAQTPGQDGRATGSLTLNGARITLTHAYAVAKRGMFDKATEDVQVTLTDAELPDTARDDMFELIQLARDGKVTAVEVRIDATGAPIGGAIYAKAFDGMVSVAGMHRFAQARKEQKAIAGRLSMDGPSTFRDVTFQYDATFDARIPRPPTAEETAAALASPPALAAAAYVAAVRRGELSAFVATLAPDAAEGYRGADARDRLTQLRTDMPADTRVTNLAPQKDGSALATVEGHENGIVIAYELKMVRVGDAWKVGK